MAKLLPVILALAGLAAGGGAGFVLKPPPPETPDAMPAAADGEAAPSRPDTPPQPEDRDGEFVAISNQFVVPILEEGHVAAMMILSLTVETAPGATEVIYAREPRLRDAFLRVLFDHAGTGGFGGNFLSSAHLTDLRQALREVAVGTAGPVVRDVLIVDLVKQTF